MGPIKDRDFLLFDSYWFNQKYEIQKGKLKIHGNQSTAEFYTDDKHTWQSIDFTHQNHLLKISFRNKSNKDLLFLIIFIDTKEKQEKLFIGTFGRNNQKLNQTVSGAIVFVERKGLGTSLYDIVDSVLKDKSYADPIYRQVLDNKEKLEEIKSILEQIRFLSKDKDKSWYEKPFFVAITLIVTLLAAVAGFLNDGSSYFDRFKVNEGNDLITTKAVAISLDSEPIILNKEIYYQDIDITHRIDIESTGNQIIYGDLIKLKSIYYADSSLIYVREHNLSSSIRLISYRFQSKIQPASVLKNKITLHLFITLVGEPSSVTYDIKEIPKEVAKITFEIEYFIGQLRKTKDIIIPIYVKDQSNIKE